MAVQTACPDSEQWQHFLLGELAPKLAAGLEDHMQQCKHCQALVARLPAEDTLVAAMRAHAPAGLEPQERDLLESLMERLQKHGPIGVADTVTGVNTLGNPKTDEASAEVHSFLQPAEAADELGRLGSFRVLEVLGRGGMGVVFRAEDTQLRRAVAVKAMLPEVAKASTARERFLREARAAAALQHDHIVPIYHVGQENGVPYLVMPLLQGDSLDAALKVTRPIKPLPVDQILKLGREIAVGLQSAHAVGLIHRDIKPANIWLDASANGRAKILDFGLARTQTDAQLTTPGLVVGTPSYMAPEQAQGKPVDGRADLYSLGCLLYELATGRIPFKGADAVATLIMAATEEPTPVEKLNPALPSGLCNLIRQLMAKNPADRPRSAEVVAETIRQLEKSVPEDDRTRSLSVARQPAPPRRWVPAALALTIVLIGGAIAYQFIIRVRDKDDKVIGEVAVPTGAKVEIVPAEKGVELKQPDLVPAEKKFDAVMKALREANPGFAGIETHRIEDGAVTELVLSSDGLASIQPLRDLPDLKKLSLAASTKGKSKLKDLSPLRAHSLVSLNVDNTAVSDLAPLSDLPLRTLSLAGTAVTDFEPLKQMPLREIRGDFDSDNARTVLKSLWALQRINDQSPVEFWKKPDPKHAALLEWIETTNKLPAAKQIEAVRNKLQELNPEFDGQMKPTIKDGVVSDLDINVDRIADISPVRVFSGLKLLYCNGNYAWKGKLADLAPLQGMRLERLACKENPRLRDLTPLRHLPLTHLHCGSTNIRDLAPLRGLRLHEFDCWYSQIKDLTPLEGMPLAILNISGCKVPSLAPLHGMPLDRLSMKQTPIKDLTPLKGLPLRWLECTLMTAPDFAPLRKTPIREIVCDHPEKQPAALALLWTLEKINGEPALSYFQQHNPAHADFLQWIAGTKQLPADKQLEELKRKLKERNPEFDPARVEAKVVNQQILALTLPPAQVTDLAPVRALSELRLLNCSGTSAQPGKLSDLAPLAGLPRLDKLYVSHTAVTDLAPLRGARLLFLHIQATAVNDLTPIKYMPLQELGCAPELVRANRSLIEGMKALQTLNGKPVKEELSRPEYRPR